MSRIRPSQSALFGATRARISSEHFDSGSLNWYIREEKPVEVYKNRDLLHSMGLRAYFCALLVAISYYLGTKLGFFLTPREQPISAFWPPNAMLLAALLLAPKKWWSIFFLAVLPAHLLVQLQSGIPVSLAIGWFVGNSAEALLGASCIRYFLKRESLFENVRSVVVFLLFSVMIAPLTTTFLDAAVVVITEDGGSYWTLWTARLFSNMLAEIILVPLIVVSGLHGLAWVRSATLARYLEVVAFGFIMVLVSMLVFGMQHSSRNSIPSLIYLPLPFLLWASVRYGLGGLGASLLGVSLISIWNAMHGRGPFFTASMDDSVLSLQALLLVITLPLVLLTAFIREHRLLESTLKEAGSKLIDSAERERRSLAEEMQNDIGKPLSVLANEVDTLKTQPDTKLKPKLDQLYRSIQQVSEATREISERIHSPQLERAGIAAVLRDLCQKVGAETGLNLNLILDELPEGLSPKVSLCLYRVADEALRNIVKHSHACKSVVELTVRRQRLLLRIVDDGVGWETEDQPATGFGITNMRERARAMGGAIDIVSRPMRGTMIELSLPLNLASTSHQRDVETSTDT